MSDPIWSNSFIPREELMELLGYTRTSTKQPIRVDVPVLEPKTMPTNIIVETKQEQILREVKEYLEREKTFLKIKKMVLDKLVCDIDEDILRKAGWFNKGDK